MRHASLAVMLFCIAAGGTSAQVPRTLFEFDPGMTIAVDLNRRVRFDFATGREKTDELSAARYKVSGGISVRIKPFRKTLLDLIDTDREHRFVLGAIYEYSRAVETGVTHIEHRVMLDGTFRNTMPAKFLLTHRSRIELRSLDSEFHWRYRDRLVFEKPLKIGKFKFTPLCGAQSGLGHFYYKIT